MNTLLSQATGRKTMKVLSFKSSDNNILITASTAADMSANWKRFRSRVSDGTAETYCNYQSTIPGKLELALPKTNSLKEISDEDSTAWLNQPPVFYETAMYNISIEISGISEEPVVIHKLKEVTELFSCIQLGDNHWIMTAPLSFLNEPGIFELSFRYKPNNKPHRTDTFSFRVVSPKLDTKKDYNYILADVNDQYNEIVFKYLTLTLQNLHLGGRSNNDVVWLSIFRNIVGAYVKAVTYIVNRPHLRQTTDVHYSRPERIKRWTPQMTERFGHIKAEKRLDREFFRHEEIINTHNTRENRFIKHTLNKIGNRLSSIVETIKARNAKAKNSDKVADSEFAELEGYVVALKRLGNSPLLRGLRGEPLHSESMVLQKRTGYAQIYRHWLLLKKGIELFEGANAIGVRPIWELYELWCYLKMRKMVENILRVNFDNRLEITENPMPMIKPFEDNNQQHTVEYHCPDGSTVYLHYQHTYNRRSGIVHTATTENRPDIVLCIKKPNGFVLTYLFDAKYRLYDDNKLNKEDREEQTEISGVDYPPSDAINQMHRYRDAIYYGPEDSQYSAKEIIGGYILFPGRIKGELKKTPYFIESIKKVNIGAFPLLPDASNPAGEGSLLFTFLYDILNKPLIYDNIKDSIPQKGLRYERF